MGFMVSRNEHQQPHGKDAEPEGLPAQGSVPVEAATPAPSSGTTGATRRVPDLAERLLSLVESRPLLAFAVIFCVLAGVHLSIMNASGAMSGIFIGKTLFVLDATALADMLLLALVASCMVLPTLLTRSGVDAFSDTAGALSASEEEYESTLAMLAEPNAIARLVFGGFWAAVLTPVFGGLVQAGVTVPQESAWLITLWLYVRLALVFGMLGSCLAHVALLHYRLSTALSTHLRVDLFDPSALAPLASHMRGSILVLSLPLWLLGPVLSRPEAATASATLLGAGSLLVLVAGFGGVWGARTAIRNAKRMVQDELNAYSREIWRRAYSNGRIVEAVALPAMAGMLTIRNQIGRMANWPGGWSNVFKCLLLAALPVVSWFGPQAIQSLLQPFL